jgi:hypothetical protein
LKGLGLLSAKPIAMKILKYQDDIAKILITQFNTENI